MVPLLLLFLPLAPTLLLVGIIHWFGDIWKLVLFREGVKWRLITLFGIPGVILTFLGARLVFRIPEILLSQILGIFLILYVLFLFLKPTFKLGEKPLTAITGGALSGFFAGVFGVGGAVRAAFLSAFNLPKAVYLATSGAIGLAIDTTRIATYITGGTKLSVLLLWGFLLFIPASFLGASIAKGIVTKIPGKKFRFVIAIFLLLVGIKLLLFPSQP